MKKQITKHQNTEKMETKTKTISEGSVPRVASVAANAIITAFDPASGRASVISYADLLAQLRGDLLGGASVGDTEGCIVRLTHFPNYDELVRLGLLDEAEKTKDGPYFKALLAYLKTLGIGKRMLFIGIANPNSQGLALVHIAEVSDTEALPL